MDLALKSQAFNESFETQSDQIYFIVRHLEDALFMRHRKHFQNYYKKKRLEKLSKNLTDQTSPQDLRPISLNESIQGSPEIQEKVFGPIYSELKNRKHVNTCSSKSSSFLVALYLITKALYLLNSLGQIFFMYRYLNAKSLFFGFSIIYRSLWLGTDWVESGAFPRITLCDLDLRRFGSNIHTLTVQCVLSGNMFNEKIYVFLWFWILAVSFINLFSFLKWIYRCSIENSRIQFVGELLVERRVLSPSVLNDHYDYNTDQQAKKDEQSQNNTTQMKSTILNSKKSKNLKSPSPLPPAQINIADSPFCLRSENIPLSITKESDKKLLRIFTEYVLGQDGVLVLRFISSNVSRMVASKVVETIWNRFRIKYNNKLLATQQKAQQSLPKIPDRNNSVEYQDFPSSSENGLKKLFIDENRLIQRRSRNLFKSPLSTTTTVSSTSSENLIISDN